MAWECLPLNERKPYRSEERKQTIVEQETTEGSNKEERQSTEPLQATRHHSRATIGRRALGVWRWASKRFQGQVTDDRG